MAEITIFFEGQRRELNELGFAIFDHMIRYDVPLDVPGDATLTLKPEALRKSVGPSMSSSWHSYASPSSSRLCA